MANLLILKGNFDWRFLSSNQKGIKTFGYHPDPIAQQGVVQARFKKLQMGEVVVDIELPVVVGECGEFAAQIGLKNRLG